MGDYNGDFFIGADGVLRHNKVFFTMQISAHTLLLDKSKNWDLSASYSYNSKSIQGSCTISPSQKISLIINHKKCSIKNWKRDSFLTIFQNRPKYHFNGLCRSASIF